MKTKESEVIQAARKIVADYKGVNHTYDPIKELDKALSAYDKEQANEGKQPEVIGYKCIKCNCMGGTGVFKVPYDTCSNCGSKGSLKEIYEHLTKQPEGEMIDELLYKATEFLRNRDYAHFVDPMELDMFAVDVANFASQQTAPLLSQIAEKDKRIAELEAENENLKSDADRFRKLQSDIEKISKSPLPDFGFRKPLWEDLNKPMDI